MITGGSISHNRARGYVVGFRNKKVSGFRCSAAGGSGFRLNIGMSEKAGRAYVPAGLRSSRITE